MVAEIPSALCFLTFAFTGSLVLGPQGCIDKKGRLCSLPSGSAGQWGDGYGSRGQWHPRSPHPPLSPLGSGSVGLFHPNCFQTATPARWAPKPFRSGAHKSYAFVSALGYSSFIDNYLLSTYCVPGTWNKSMNKAKTFLL